MQSVGAEMNLAETAFLVPRDDGWSLRWFTPTVEVDLCGHATLASAHALWSESILDPADVVARQRADRTEFSGDARKTIGSGTWSSRSAWRGKAEVCGEEQVRLPR